jgi:hypothetical protein
MRRWLTITAYLIRDQLGSWWENPASVIARITVIVFFVSAAATILVMYSGMAKDLQRRLAELGANRIVYHQAYNPAQQPGVPPLHEQLRPWLDGGRLYVLRNTYRAAEHHGKTLGPVYSYDPAAAYEVRRRDSGATPYIVLTRKHPPGRTLPIVVRDLRVMAVAQRPPAWIAPLNLEQLVLAPQSSPVLSPNSSGSWVGIVQLAQSERSVSEVVRLIRTLHDADADQSLRLRDLGRLQATLASINEKTNLWRQVVLFGFGSGIALISGAVFIFEYDRHEYVNQLLRSMGVSRIALFCRHGLEALFVANLALLASVLLLVPGLPWIYQSLDVSTTALPGVGGLFASETGAVLLAFVNAGTLAALIPIALTMRRSVGNVLQ